MIGHTTPQAGFTDFVHKHSDAVIGTPIRVLVIIIGALVLRFVANRFIDRLARTSSEGAMPGLLRPLREKVATSALLEATALVSERRQQRAATIASVLKSGVSFLLFMIALLMVLIEVHLDPTPLLAGSSIAAVALGFGAQNLVKDFLGGMFIMLEDQYGVGDVVDVKEATGEVEAVGLRTTRLRDVQGTVWYVRNGEIVRVGNKSQGWAVVVLDIPVASSADPLVAGNAMLAAATAMAAEEDWATVFVGEPEIKGIESFDRDQTTVRLTARVKPLEQWRVARELRERVRNGLADAGINYAVKPL